MMNGIAGLLVDIAANNNCRDPYSWSLADTKLLDKYHFLLPTTYYYAPDNNTRVSNKNDRRCRTREAEQ